MGKLGTIFGIVAAVLAIAAAVLSFLISGKRALYEDRAGKLAGTVAQMAAKIDENSNTGVKDSVTFTAKAPDAPETGSLSWKTFAADPSAFDATLGSALALAGKINAQRDSLAGAMATAAADLKMDIDQADLRELADESKFSAGLTAVDTHVKAVSARDQAMLEALVRASESLNHPLDPGPFSRREETTDADGNPVQGPFPCRAPLEEFTGNVKGVVTRCNDYADAIAAGIRSVTKFTWQADAEKVRDEREYSGALTSLQNDFSEINEQLALYEQAKREVAEHKTRISQLTDELEETGGELKDTKRELVKAKAEVKKYKDMAGISEAGPEGIDPNLTGEVVQVNEEWNFVVVTVGRRNNVQENLKMLVARDDKLVARLQLSKVFGKVSVAEILPEANVEKVRVGDRVILPKMLDERD
jgi:hypothetical protein